MANGHIAIKSHEGQEEVLSGSQKEEEIELGYAGLKENGPILSQKDHEQFGDSDSSISHFQEWEVSQKEIHGGVEMGVGTDQKYDEKVACDCHDVDGKEYAEE